MLIAARTTADEAKRKELYSRFQKRLAENPPYNFLVYLDAIWVVNKDVKGVKTRIRAIMAPALSGISRVVQELMGRYLLSRLTGEPGGSWAHQRWGFRADALDPGDPATAL
jgi:hypothetical protein